MLMAHWNAKVRSVIKFSFICSLDPHTNIIWQCASSTLTSRANHAYSTNSGDILSIQKNIRGFPDAGHYNFHKMTCFSTSSVFFYFLLNFYIHLSVTLQQFVLFILNIGYWRDTLSGWDLDVYYKNKMNDKGREAENHWGWRVPNKT